MEKANVLKTVRLIQATKRKEIFFETLLLLIPLFLVGMILILSLCLCLCPV
tara:strand:+ start:470 stop:622 length:153 start_codon:yes stop_codon:yes gene_type:complete